MRAQRMTATQPPHRQPGTPRRTKALDGDPRVLRAARRVPTTRGHPGGNGRLVDSNQPDDHGAHVSLKGVGNEACRRSYDAPYAAGFALRIKSTSLPARCARGNHSLRASSLRRRRTVFRATAVCPNRGTMTATRGRRFGDGAVKTSKSGPVCRFPERRTRRISRPARRRAAFGRRWLRGPERPSLPAASL